MQRAIPALFVALLLLAVGYVVAHARSNRPLISSPSAAVEQGLPTIEPSASAAGTVGADAGAEAPPPTTLQAVLEGGPVPKLPNTAPARVDLGVILFTHDKAQFAGKKSRSKQEARRLATELIAEARENFTEAVKKGDPGSTGDAGTVPRGVLEPALEYVVYTLEKGQVFEEPLDTPRGYWIVKRTR